MKGQLYITRYGCAEDEARKGNDVRNLQVLIPAQRVFISSPATDPFVPISKYYQDGWCDRSDIYVCEVPNAKVHLPSGLVCTRDFKVLTDRFMEDRRYGFVPFGKRQPSRVEKIAGTCSTINYCYATNLWHWLVDCLPKVHSLSKVAPASGVTLLMPTSVREFQRESLQRILPRGFSVRYESDLEWVEVENFLWASLVSHRCLGVLPEEYYRAIRQPIFRSFGLSDQHEKRERIYISRQKARWRRVTNEPEVMAYLEKFGFRLVNLEDISFRDEVELFHRAEIIVGPHGAGLSDFMYAGDVSVVVFYPTRVPPNYFHSLARGLGQKHYFLCADEAGEDDSFAVDLGQLKQLIEGEMGLP